MKKITFILFAFQFSLVSCQTNFEKTEWLKHNTIENTKNPRISMLDDLMNNHLKIGMNKEDVINLLGKPLTDKTEAILPQG